MERQYDLVIIGAGPAGMTAALYASRAGLSTVMIDADAPGGKLLKTYMVENYPGIPSIPGPDLAITMYQQSVSFGASFVNGRVQTINKNRQVILENGDIYNAGSVIIATGANPRHLQIKGEEEALGHGESFCAVCDGAFYRNKDVVVIGGGNSALEESLFLTKFASKVTIVTRRDLFTAEERIQKEVLSNPKIHWIKKHIPVEIINKDGSVTGIVLKNVVDDDTIEIPCSGLFPYIGSVPATEFAKDLGILNESGYIPVNVQMETGVPGIYAAGDCTYTVLRQIVTACGDGAIAAQEAFHFVNGY